MVTKYQDGNLDFASAFGRILWYEPVYVALCSIPLLFPGRLFPLDYHPLFLGAVVAFLPLRWIWHKLSSLEIHPFFCRLPVLVLLISAVIGIWISPQKAVSLSTAGFLICSLAIYHSVVNFPPLQTNPILLIWILSCGVLVISLFAPTLVLWKPEFRLFSLPLYGYLGFGRANQLNWVREGIHANVLAGLLLPSLLLLFSAADEMSKQLPKVLQRKQKLIYVSLLGICVYWALLLLLTQSRAAYLGLGVATGVVLAVRTPKLLPLIVAVVLLLIAVPVAMGYVTLSSFWGMESLLGGGEFRWDVWSNAAYALSDAPLTGIGFGMYSVVVPSFYPFVYVDGSLAEHAHNIFLQISLDVGLPGLIAYLSILMQSVFMLWRLAGERVNPRRRALALGAAGAFTGITVHGIFDAVLWGTKVMFIPWLLLALIVLLHQQQLTLGKRERIPWW